MPWLCKTTNTKSQEDCLQQWLPKYWFSNAEIDVTGVIFGKFGLFIWVQWFHLQSLVKPLDVTEALKSR